MRNRTAFAMIRAPLGASACAGTGFGAVGCGARAASVSRGDFDVRLFSELVAEIDQRTGGISRSVVTTGYEANFPRSYWLRAPPAGGREGESGTPASL